MRARDALLVDLYLRGLPVDEIAERVGYAITRSVSRRLGQLREQGHGIPRRSWKSAPKNGRRPNPSTVEQRYAQYFVKGDAATCWGWRGTLSPEGYGQFAVDGTLWLAHRYVYTREVGGIPPGRELHHICERPDCVNPAHLLPVTRAEHGRFSRRARQTHCKHGHPFDGENTIWTSPTTRACRACGRAKARRREARLREGASA